MLFKPKLSFHRKRPAAYIYAVVFNSSFSVLLILTLFASFAIQPIHQAYANEALVEEEIQIELPPVADTVNLVDEAAVESGDSELLENDSNNAVPPTEESNPVSLEPDSDTQDREAIDIDTETESNLVTEVLDSEHTASSLDLLAEQTIMETEELVATTSSQESGEDSSEPDQVDDLDIEVVNDSSIDANDTTTPEEVEVTINAETVDVQNVPTTTNQGVEEVNLVEAQNMVTEDNYYQFNKQSCVAIGDGTFHCSADAKSGIDLNAVVYSDLGENANMEIFLRTSTGEVKQLTSNEYDDTSPSYSAESLQIVWQRLIDDRYQIILYDIEEEKENQLTFSRTNNMEPKVSEEGLVWQAWDGNDWEIMYFDGKYTDQLTDNLSQDVAPAINDGYVLWSVLGSSEQEARVYSLASGEVLNINGYEGGVITNPRFVLVYDTKFDNGDVVTQGFDPTTGLSAPIAAHPTENPVDLPDTDGTGETRALIQNKSSQKDEFNFDGTKNTTGSSTPNGFSNPTATTTAVSATLNLKQVVDTAPTSSVSDTISSTEATTTETFFELTDYDLILTPPPTTTSAKASTTN